MSTAASYVWIITACGQVGKSVFSPSLNLVGNDLLTANCVSHITFPHFIRFLCYAVAAMLYLEVFLYERGKVLWQKRHLPSVRLMFQLSFSSSRKLMPQIVPRSGRGAIDSSIHPCRYQFFGAFHACYPAWTHTLVDVSQHHHN